MTERGYTAEFAQRVFKQLEGFGSYGFPESHAASFALLVYVMQLAQVVLCRCVCLRFIRTVCPWVFISLHRSLLMQKIMGWK